MLSLGLFFAGLALLALASHAAKFGELGEVRTAFPWFISVGGGCLAASFLLQYRSLLLQKKSARNWKEMFIKHPVFQEFFSPGQPVEEENIVAVLARRLIELKQRERLIADFAEDLLFSLDESLTIVDLNTSAAMKLKYSRDELLGRKLSSLFVERANLDSLLRLTAMTAGSMESFDCRLKGGDDRIADYHCTGEFSQTNRWFYLVCRDVTTEKEVQRLKDRMLAMLGHDVKTPLGSIRLGLASIARDEQLSTESSALLDSAILSVKRISTLTDDMLLLMQGSSGKLVANIQTVGLEEVILQIAQEFRNEIASRSQQLDLQLKDLLVEADESQLKQIMANLVSNAVKYSGTGATIRICCALADDVAQSQALIKVEDSGPGIEENRREMIFEPYCRIDQTAETGVGLGLALCKELVRAQNGLIGVNASDLGGACFWLTLPVTTE